MEADGTVGLADGKDAALAENRGLRAEHDLRPRLDSQRCARQDQDRTVDDVRARAARPGRVPADQLETEALSGIEHIGEFLTGGAQQGQDEELQSHAAAIGYILSRFSLYNIEQIPTEAREKLHRIAKDLQLVETMRIYMDGGRSLKALRERISELNTQLTDLVEQMP